MSARFHDNRSRVCDIDAEYFEHRGVLALLPHTHHHHLNTGNTQQRHRPERNAVAGSDAARAHDVAIVQAFHDRIRCEFTRQMMVLSAVKLRVESRANAQPMRLVCQRRIRTSITS